MQSTPIFVPKETVSDDNYLVVRVPHASGARVQRGEVIAELETSKATLELTSPDVGHFHHRLKEGESISVGGLLGVVTDSVTIDDAVFREIEQRAPRALADEAQRVATAEDPAAAARTAAPRKKDGQRITRPAQELIDRHGLSLESFGALDVVRQSDVEAVLASATRSATQASYHPATQARHGARIVVIGAGLHAKTCIETLVANKTFEIAGVVDRALPIGEQVLGYPVIGRDEDLARLYEEGIRFAVNGVGAAGNHPLRARVFRRIKEAGFAIPALVHPTAFVAPSARLGEGVQVMAKAVVDTEVTIGDDSIVNTGTIVSHGCRIGNHVHVAPGAVLAGSITIGDNSLIGMGVTAYFGLTIGRDAVVPNGIDLFADVPNGTVMHPSKRPTARGGSTEHGE